ncbi:MAG TPA: DMT family transporter [Geminicoccus sp.]|uniref:DMT family transporter n=1 Tax=Geminicoccus sp. TaxID=2024832 RepID=UPI002E34C3DD|nr:DMT family transporter [Geminicoccus sp.]HEX2527841.1 DMT family transporter [Geminicoccus sp.]
MPCVPRAGYRTSSAPEPTLPIATDNLRAALLMAAASTLFTLNDALVKVLTGGGAQIGLILAVRGVFMVLIYLIVFRSQLPIWSTRQVLEPTNLVRALFEATLSWAMFTSLMLLPIATVTALYFTTPLLATALGAAVLGERVGIWRWSAVVVGFIGILVAIRPGSTAFEPALLLPLLAALLSAGRDLVTRRLPHDLPSGVVAVSTASAMMGSGFVSLPAAPWSNVSLALVAVLGGSALITALALFAYIRASRLGEISFLAPIRYLSILTAMILGLLIWQDVPDRWDLAGTLLIVASGCLIFYRERVRMQAA